MARSIDISVTSSELPTQGTVFLNKDGLVYRVPPVVADSLRAGVLEVIYFKNLPITGDQAFAKATFTPGFGVLVEFYDCISKFENVETIKSSVGDISEAYNSFFSKLLKAKEEIGLAFNKMRDFVKV